MSGSMLPDSMIAATLFLTFILLEISAPPGRQARL